MKNQKPQQFYRVALYPLLILFLCTTLVPLAGFSQGVIAKHIAELKQDAGFKENINIFSVSSLPADEKITKLLTKFTLLNINSTLKEILDNKPAHFSLDIPFDNGLKNFHVLLYKVEISPGGINLLTSNNSTVPKGNNMSHYRGIVDNDKASLVSFSFSETETMGIISNYNGNYVIGKLEGKDDRFIVYNDKDLVPKNSFECTTKDNGLPASQRELQKTASTPSPSAVLTTKCVNWYWETDYDVFVNKGSLANVNNYIQGVFNQVATLYANDGISINLRTVFIWTTADPYTGPSTSLFLDQFGAYRTSFDGDMANLIGFYGNGGIAWVNTLCSSSSVARQCYTGIGTSYNTVPAYSWTIEVIAHEEGHLLGSSHTHDCVWNGNSTQIDGCGDVAGYKSGSCPTVVPALPVGGGTIMSYCHLTSAGINFNLGFGPQPKARITNFINAAACLVACSGCTVPAIPGTITGNITACPGTSQTYTITAVSGATSYTWTIPAGWSGTSTTNAITLTAGTTGGSITVKANNSCGSSSVSTCSVSVLSVPPQPGAISGSMVVSPFTGVQYSISTVSGATSYAWTVPQGWNGTSSANSISAVTGTSGGNIVVKAINVCGSSISRSMPVSVSVIVPVTLIYFNGQLNNHKVLLSWRTAQEINCQGYEVERSKDSRNYEPLGFVAAMGNTNSNNDYAFNDDNPYQDLSFYRLKIKDRDGSFAYSNIVTIKNNDAVSTSFSLFPNPATTEIHLKILSGLNRKIRAEIYNAQGGKMISRTIETSIGINNELLNLEWLNSGIYFIMFRDQENKIVYKTSFIKL